jgi:hypothetical protein
MNAWSWLSLPLCLLCPALAHAQSSAQDAVQLFDEAERLMQAGRVGDACPKYAASMQLDPQLGALLHLADCYEKNGQLASAWSSFRRAEDMAQKRGDDRLSLAREYAARLEPRLSRVSVVVAEPTTAQLEVRLDGRVIAPAGWNTSSPIDAGRHLLEARAPGHEAWTTTVSIVGEQQQARVEVPTLRPIADGVVAEPALPPRERGPVVLRSVGWLGVGVGAVGLGVGVAFLAKRSSRLDQRADVCPSLHDCSDEQSDRIGALTTQARTADTIATVGFVAGGVLVAGGVTALIVAATKPRRSSAWLAPVVTHQSLAVTGGLKW